jgi:Rrf2 family transcriptional regulator, iron-sulfur cluster assembly transcription factor
MGRFIERSATMRLTTRGRLAVAAMIDLALRSPSGPVALAGIASRQQISLSYLQALFARLRRHGLVEATRGPGGGYALGREAQGITVADIIVAVDEPIVTVGCGGKGHCRGDGTPTCLAHELWAGLNARLTDCLDAVSLKELVDGQLEKGVPSATTPLKRAISSRPVLEPIRVTGPNSVFALGDAASR